jgi:hypothetical protein
MRCSAEVTDHRLDRGAALHLPADGLGDAPDLARGPDFEAVWIIMAAITLVDMDALDLDAVRFCSSTMIGSSV